MHNCAKDCRLKFKILNALIKRNQSESIIIVLLLKYCCQFVGINLPIGQVIAIHKMAVRMEFILISSMRRNVHMFINKKCWETLSLSANCSSWVSYTKPSYTSAFRNSYPKVNLPGNDAKMWSASVKSYAPVEKSWTQKRYVHISHIVINKLKFISLFLIK